LLYPIRKKYLLLEKTASAVFFAIKQKTFHYGFAGNLFGRCKLILTQIPRKVSLAGHQS